jgi:hypothetical protein
MIKPIPFRISISKMTESHRETFWLSIEHPDYKAKSILNTDKIGTMTENMSENIDEIRYMALRYAMLFGLSYDDVIDPYVDTHPESESSKEFRMDEYQMALEIQND